MCTLYAKHKDKEASTILYCTELNHKTPLLQEQSLCEQSIEPAPPTRSERHQSDVMTKSRGIKKIRWASWSKEEDDFVLNAVKEKYSLLVDQL